MDIFSSYEVSNTYEMMTTHRNHTRIEKGRRVTGLVSQLFVYSTVVGVHVSAVVFLVCLWRAGRAKVRHLFLINLSFLIILINFLEIASTAHSLFQVHTHHLSYTYLVFMDAMLSLVELPTLIFINTDRLLEVLLNIKYNLYVTKFRAIFLLVWTWLI